MSTEKNRTNLISVLHPRHHDDDETIPPSNIAEQDDKAPYPALKEEKYKIRDHPSSSKKRNSLWNTIKSEYRDRKSKISKRCFVQEKKLKVFLGSFIIILMLINVALIVSFGVDFFSKKDTELISANGALSYIASSLAADPILDIIAGPSCPADYDSLLLGVWPGTTNGCECAAYLRSGVCRKSGRGANEGSCNDISWIDSINLYDWGSSQWCVLKAKSGSQYQKAVKCEQGFRKCSSGICVLDTLDCPVTKVKMTGGVISTESVVGESPVIGFAITPNDIPCFSDDRFASGPVAPYVLIDENEDGCGRYGLDDQYSFALAQQVQKEVFDQNDFPRRVYSLPDYAPIYKKTESVLSYRRRVSVAEKEICLNMNTELLQRPSSVTKDLKRFLIGTLIAAFIIHGMFILLVATGVCIESCFHRSLSKALQGYDESKFWIIVYLIGAIVEYIDFLVMFAATVHFRAKMIEVNNYLMGLTDAGCFLDLQAQAAVSDFETVVDVVIGSFFKYSLSLFLTGSFAVFSCGYLLWRVRLG